KAFMERWYSVFLDTISIRPGAVFQEDLMQELADSDVVVLLNSPTIKDRPYVQKEIAFADQAGVGGVQVVWPDEKPLREGAYFSPVRLDADRGEDHVQARRPPQTDRPQGGRSSRCQAAHRLARDARGAGCRADPRLCPHQGLGCGALSRAPHRAAQGYQPH